MEFGMELIFVPSSRACIQTQLDNPIKWIIGNLDRFQQSQSEWVFQNFDTKYG